MLGEHHSPSKAGYGESPWPSSYRMLARCPTKPSRSFAFVPCTVWNWAIPRLIWPISSGSAVRPSVAGGTAYAPTASTACPAPNRQATGHRTPAVRLPGRPHQGLDRRQLPRETGPQPPPVDSPRRPRSDPQGVPHRPGGANGRPVPASLGLHVQEARAACPQARSPTRSRSGCTRSAIDAASGTGGCGDPVDRRGRPVEADHQPGSGYARKAEPSDHGSAGAAHPGEPRSRRSATRASLRFMTYKGFR